MPRRSHLPPIHPGEILREEFMAPFNLSANRLASMLDVPANRVTAILNGTRSVTAETALRLSAAFGTSPEFWTNLQSLYELEVARRSTGAKIERTVERMREVEPA